jgi:hypothetical protein
MFTHVVKQLVYMFIADFQNFSNFAFARARDGATTISSLLFVHRGRFPARYYGAPKDAYENTFVAAARPL